MNTLNFSKSAAWRNAASRTIFRSLSFYQQQQQSRQSNVLRATPQYSVFGENCLLALKVLPPELRLLHKSNTLVTDNRKKGRILFEWVPRLADGSISRDTSLRFALSPEEIGLVLYQLPQHEISISRSMSAENNATTIILLLYREPTKQLFCSRASISARQDYCHSGSEEIPG